MLKRFLSFLALFLCLPVIARAQASVQLWADVDYAGTHNGTQAQPFGAIDGAAWSIINGYLAKGDVTIHFSARDAKTDTDDGSFGTIDLTLKSETTSNRLVLDGSKYYNTNDSSPNWTAYNSSGDCIPQVVFSTPCQLLFCEQLCEPEFKPRQTQQHLHCRISNCFNGGQ